MFWVWNRSAAESSLSAHPLRYLEVGETAVFELGFEFTDSAEQIETLRQMDAEQAKSFSPVQ